MHSLFKASCLIIALTIFLHCVEKDIIPVDAFNPPDLKTTNIFIKENYLDNTSFTPGYSSGLIRSDQIFLEWTAYQKEDFFYYKLYVPDESPFIIKNPESNWYIDGGLKQDTWYMYRLQLFNSYGFFKIDSLSLKTPRFLPPVNLRFKVQPSDKILLFWKNQCESADRFRIYRKQLSHPSSAFSVIGISPDTFYVDSTIVHGELYEYQVTAFNDFESTDRSSSVTAKAEYIFAIPQLDSIRQQLPTRVVNLYWTDNSTAEEGFKIYRLNPGDIFRLIATVPTNTTFYSDTDTVQALQYFEDYAYYITAFIQETETDPSQTSSITIKSILPYIQVGTDHIDLAYPFHTAFDDARGQILYLESELKIPMTITALAFDFESPPGNIMHHFTVRMKHTNLPFYPDDNFDNSGYNVCLNDSLTIQLTGWVKIPLNPAFTYDGQRNLIVDISFDNENYGTTGICNSYSSQFNRHIIQRSRSLLGDPLFWTSGYARPFIPNIRFYHNDTLQFSKNSHYK